MTPAFGALVPEEHSYTQPAAELVMPFDATTGKVTFLTVSNVNGVSVAGAGITTHWEFWSDTCTHLFDTSICITLNDTVVVDVTNITAIDINNQPTGPSADLSGNRGIVTVTAFETNSTCGSVFQIRDLLGFFPPFIDDSLVGSFTMADTEVGYAFGNDALGLGVNDSGTQIALPDPLLVKAYDFLTFNPQDLQASLLVITRLREFLETATQTAAVAPTSSSAQLTVEFTDVNEASTSLPDITVGCARFASVAAASTLPSNLTPIIPATVTVDSPGIIRLRPRVNLSATDYLWGIHGYAVGPYGASSTIKYEYIGGSASQAFIDAPGSLID